MSEGTLHLNEKLFGFGGKIPFIEKTPFIGLTSSFNTVVTRTAFPFFTFLDFY